MSSAEATPTLGEFGFDAKSGELTDGGMVLPQKRGEERALDDVCATIRALEANIAREIDRLVCTSCERYSLRSGMRCTLCNDRREVT